MRLLHTPVRKMGVISFLMTSLVRLCIIGSQYSMHEAQLRQEVELNFQLWKLCGGLRGHPQLSPRLSGHGLFRLIILVGVLVAEKNVIVGGE